MFKGRKVEEGQGCYCISKGIELADRAGQQDCLPSGKSGIDGSQAEEFRL